MSFHGLVPFSLTLLLLLIPYFTLNVFLTLSKTLTSLPILAAVAP